MGRSRRVRPRGGVWKFAGAVFLAACGSEPVQSSVAPILDVDIATTRARFSCESPQVPNSHRAHACRILGDFANSPAFDRWPTTGVDTWIGLEHQITSGQEAPAGEYFRIIRISRGAPTIPETRELPPDRLLPYSVVDIPAARFANVTDSVRGVENDLRDHREWNALISALSTGGAVDAEAVRRVQALDASVPGTLVRGPDAAIQTEGTSVRFHGMVDERVRLAADGRMLLVDVTDGAIELYRLPDPATLAAPPPSPPPIARTEASCAVDPRGTDASPLSPVPIAYTSFHHGGQPVQRYAWVGERVAYLTREVTRDPCVMRRIVSVADQVYTWYSEMTGREPEKDLQYEGRNIVAVMNDLPGAALGRLGHHGIELLDEHFEALYTSVRDRNEFDHIIFYEMGRNFWFFGPQLDYQGPDAGQPYIPTVGTGYAILMRYLSMEATQVRSVPTFNGHPFATFKAEEEGLLDRYVHDPTMNFDNTLRIQRAPENPVGAAWTGFSASFLLRLVRVHGTEFLAAFWRRVAVRPAAQTTQDAIDNMVIAASHASRRNLAPLFAERWRFPVSEAARRQASRAGPTVDFARYDAPVTAPP